MQIYSNSLATEILSPSDIFQTSTLCHDHRMICDLCRMMLSNKGLSCDLEVDMKISYANLMFFHAKIMLASLFILIHLLLCLLIFQRNIMISLRSKHPSTNIHERSVILSQTRPTPNQEVLTQGKNVQKHRISRDCLHNKGKVAIW